MKNGILQIAGIGPGSYEQMTVRCARALENCDCIVGYELYVELVRERFPDKKFITTPMRKEEERCHLALAEASKGKKVVLVCSGDPGVYGMSGLIYEIYAKFREKFSNVEIDVLPGVTAALSGAGLLGAPLIHDFSVISLSDLMTPWEKIEKRLEYAAAADFCIVLYNPMSRGRKDCLSKACRILMRTLSEGTPCAYAWNIGREGEEYEILTLKELAVAKLDMLATVFIGNSRTKIIDTSQGKKLVTPRGYEFEETGES